MRGHPNDGVDLRIEVVPSSQRLDGDRVLLDLALLAFEVLFADEAKHAGEIIGAPQNP